MSVSVAAAAATHVEREEDLEASGEVFNSLVEGVLYVMSRSVGDSKPEAL